VFLVLTTLALFLCKWLNTFCILTKLCLSSQTFFLLKQLGFFLYKSHLMKEILVQLLVFSTCTCYFTKHYCTKHYLRCTLSLMETEDFLMAAAMASWFLSTCKIQVQVKEKLLMYCGIRHFPAVYISCKCNILRNCIILNLCNFYLDHFFQQKHFCSTGEYASCHFMSPELKENYL